ncbi:MAG: 2-oxo acid dehydrogenase subunit E2, partial [Actinobacteria bacterium]|nr:2-oxo acid dehydrogenase subunit E2 [Actinomycetota bacterium]
MASTFALPAVGDTMVEAVVEEWFVAVGDHVALDQVICAIETDKSVVEMTTPFAGTVLQLGGEAGATIAVGEPLIIVGENGEVPQSPAVGNAPESSSAELSVNPVSHSAQPPQSGQAGDVRSPVLRRLAEALDVRVDDLVGSGHAGQITRADIEAAAAAPLPQR